MKKAKVNSKNGLVKIILKSSSNEQLDIGTVNKLTMGMDGFLPFKVTMGNGGTFSLLYEANGYVTLKEYLKKPIGKLAFKVLVESSTDIMANITNNGLNYANVILDLDSVLVNTGNGKVMFIYYPVFGYTNGKYFNTFLADIMKNMKNPKNEDISHLTRLNMLLKNPSNLSWEAIKDYTSSITITPPIQPGMMLQQMPIQPVMNQEPMASHNNQEMVASEPVQNNISCPTCGNKNILVGARFCVRCGNTLENRIINIPNVPEMSETWVLPVNMDDANKEELITNQTELNPVAMKICKICGNRDNMLDASFCKECGTSFDADNNMQKAENNFEPQVTINPFVNNGNEGATTILTNTLGDEGATTILSVEPAKPIGSIFQKRIQKKCVINKDSFKLGKSSICDYVVEGNTNVSRNHADIIYDNMKYYIVDNSSTNGTLIDGKRIQSNVKTELTDGCTITLADEEFLFNLF